MVKLGKTSLSSQFVQLSDTPTNFHRPSTCRSTKLAKSLNPHRLIPQKRVDPVRLRQSRIYDIYELFSRFLVSPPTPPMSKDLVGIWNNCSETWVPSKYRILLRSGHPFLSWKCLNFSDFSKLTTPSSLKENEYVPITSISYLRFVLILSIKFHPNLSPLRVFQDLRFPRFMFPPSTLYVSRSDSN